MYNPNVQSYQKLEGYSVKLLHKLMFYSQICATEKQKQSRLKHLHNYSTSLMLEIKVHKS